MRCPRCEGALDEREREGVTIDVCRGCRGVWLDRGELEKLLARVGQAARDDDGEDDDDDDEDGDDDDRGGGRRGRRRGWFDRLGGLFD
jgi:Zn-finger nucleic acid-binding protein